MDKFIQFVENHWWMWLALVVVLILLIYEELKDKLHGVKRIAPAELTQLINRDEAVVLDMRDRQAFAKGHIIDSLNLTPAELAVDDKKLEKFKTKTIVIVDAMGQSSAAANTLRKLGFEKVFILAGGITAWRNLGLPVSKK